MTARLLAAVIALGLTVAACGDAGGDPPNAPTVAVAVEGLLNPIGLAVLPDGRLLIAEEGTGAGDDSAGVSLLERDGTVSRVVSGLPSSRDSGDLSGSPLVAVSPDGEVAYTAHFDSGSLLTFPVPSRNTGARPLGLDDLEPAMTPLNNVRLINGFDMTFDPAGMPVVTDASGNGVATMTAAGATRFIHRFGEIPAPGRESLTIDAVPTGIDRVGDEYFVTLTGGCPYPEGSGRLVAIDDQRNERLVADGLDMPIDVAVDAAGTVWVLEFARFDEDASCFTGEGYLPGTGRLSRLGDDGLETVLAGLDHPGAVEPAEDGSLYVSEVFAGRVLRLTFTTADAAPVPTTTAAGSPLTFVEVAAESGLDFRHGAFAESVSNDRVAAMGGGVCWLDFDQDGWLDLYLVNSHAVAEASLWAGRGGLPANALYRNDGGSFTRMGDSGAELAMRGSGCVAADLDLDGDTDLYVTADGPNALLRNDGGGRFTEIGVAAGVAAPEWNTAAVVGDVDGNGLPDLYVGAFIDLERTVENPVGAFPQDYPGLPDRLYLNQGGLRFREATDEAGLVREDRTLGALLADLGGDGLLDLYVANDGNPNRLYVNEIGAAIVRFVDRTDTAGVGDSGSGMGVAGGDYDGDGALDLLVTNWERELHALYRRSAADDGGLAFDYSTFRIGLAGLGNGQTGWGATWADFDLDTDLDLLIVNGRVPVTDLETDPQLARLYGNLLAEGEPGQLRDWTTRTGLDVVGPMLARGSAAADYDNDGDLDVAVNTVGGPVRLLRNDVAAGNWVEVSLAGAPPGAVVVAMLPDGTRLVRHLHAGSSYLSSEDPRLHFGLGNADRADIEVIWPDGHTSSIEAAANALVTVSR